MMFSNSTVIRMVAFLESIGIPVIPASSLVPTVFPGLDIQYGCVLVDESRLIHVGDILHEAGHLSITDASMRDAPRLSPTGGEEMSALAWSYAAAMHLSLAAETVFYAESYHDFGNDLVEHFANGNYIGLPLMQKFGMTIEPRRAASCGVLPYPHMARWLR